MKVQKAIVVIALKVTFALSTAWAGELSPAQYVDITLARLHLALESAQERNQLLSKEEDDLLYAQYGTTAPAYYAFMGTHSREVDLYLYEHPQIKAELDRLGTELRRRADEREAKRKKELGIK